MPVSEFVYFKIYIAKSENVSITVLAFSDDEDVSEEAYQGDTLYIVLEGQGEFTIDGLPNILGAGESIVMPYSIPHSVKAVTNFKMLLTVVK